MMDCAIPQRQDENGERPLVEPAHFTSEEERDRLGSDSQGTYLQR